MRIYIVVLAASAALLHACSESSGSSETATIENQVKRNSATAQQFSVAPEKHGSDLVTRAALDTGINSSEVKEFPTSARGAILAWLRLNTACRGGTPEGKTDAEREAWTDEVCSAREVAYSEMQKAGYCYGKDWQAGYQMNVHSCSEGNRPSIDSLTETELSEVPTGAFCNATNSKGRTVFAATDFAVIKIDGHVMKLPLGDNYWSSTQFKSDEQDVQVTFKPRVGERTTGEESVTEPMTMSVTAGGHAATIHVSRTCGA